MEIMLRDFRQAIAKWKLVETISGSQSPNGNYLKLFPAANCQMEIVYHRFQASISGWKLSEVVFGNQLLRYNGPKPFHAWHCDDTTA
jgi:hypothetical protein